MAGLLSKYLEIPHRTAIGSQYSYSLTGLQDIQGPLGHQQRHRAGVAGRIYLCYLCHGASSQAFGRSIRDSGKYRFAAPLDPAVNPLATGFNKQQRVGYTLSTQEEL